MSNRVIVSTALAVLSAASASLFAGTVRTFENLPEGFYGTSFTDSGVTYRDVNQTDVVFPNGTTASAADLGDNVVSEDASFFYPDFPGYGSPVKSLTFGKTYVNGPNLSIGPLATVWMDLANPASAASFDMAYYENGPWGGIKFHLDAVSSGSVVASDVFVIADGGGRDNATFRTMSVSAATFDQLHFYATFGTDFSAPRAMIDNLTLSDVPEPSLGCAVASIALLARRRQDFI